MGRSSTIWIYFPVKEMENICSEPPLATINLSPNIESSADSNLSVPVSTVYAEISIMPFITKSVRIRAQNQSESERPIWRMWQLMGGGAALGSTHVSTAWVGRHGSWLLILPVTQQLPRLQTINQVSALFQTYPAVKQRCYYILWYDSSNLCLILYFLN